jgi:hypothetical protein
MHGGASGTLEVGELDDRYRRVSPTARWIVVSADVL